MTCTFIGHRDAPFFIEEKLRSVAEDLIQNAGATEFLIGNNGNFDALALKVIEDLKEKYTDVGYQTVLAYLPVKNTVRHNNTTFPEGFEKFPPRLAIIKRNEWMIDNADYVVAYVRYTHSNTNKFITYAEKKGKRVINIAENFIPSV